MKRITVLLAAMIAGLILCGGAAAEKIITLTFTGDCTLGTEETTKNTADSIYKVAEAEGYGYFLENFRDIFAEDDCTVVNLECVLSDNGEGAADKDFCFRGPEKFVSILKEGSVEAVSLANNHSRDFGWDGLWNTMRVLDEAGIGWARDTDLFFFEKDGIRIAFAGVDHGIMQWSDYIIRDKLLEMQKNGEINAAVLLIHEGKEYYPKHLGEQVEYSEYFVNNAGADLVIIHHPHVLQGIRILNNRSIFYSLGNFVFGGHNRISRNDTEKTNSLYSLVVQAKMYFSDDGVYEGQQIILYPAYDSGTYPQNNYQPMRVTAEEAVPVMEAIQYDTEWPLPALQTDEKGRAYAILDYLPAGEEEPEGKEPEEGQPEAAMPQPDRNR